jgi:K+-sensing histidine kinase KdpD
VRSAIGPASGQRLRNPLDPSVAIRRLQSLSRSVRPAPYVISSGLVLLLAMALNIAGSDERYVATVVAFLLAVLLFALIWGRGPGIAAALTGSIAFVYYCVPPANRSAFITSEEVFLLVGLLAVPVGLGDLSERMRVAQSSAEQLSASDQFQRTLLSSISHDLRTPLTAVKWCLGTLLAEGERLEPSLCHELTTVAYEGTKQLDRILLQVLEMTRLEAGAVQLKRESVPVETLVQNALAQMGVRLDRPCEIDVPHDIPPITVDPVLLSNALANVIDNALKYAPSNLPIAVGARLDRSDVIISVADRGPGVPPHVIDRIFQKFYWIGGSGPAEGVHGSGLGLAIAKGIVDAHGGRIWAEAGDGHGTVVRLRMPVEA